MLFASSTLLDGVRLPVLDATTATMGNIINMVYIVIGAFATLFIVRGALLYVTHGSDPKLNVEARNTIIYSVGALAGSTFVFVLIKLIGANL